MVVEIIDTKRIVSFLEDGGGGIRLMKGKSVLVMTVIGDSELIFKTAQCQNVGNSSRIIPYFTDIF